MFCATEYFVTNVIYLPFEGKLHFNYLYQSMLCSHAI